MKLYGKKARKISKISKKKKTESPPSSPPKKTIQYLEPSSFKLPTNNPQSKWSVHKLRYLGNLLNWTFTAVRAFQFFMCILPVSYGSYDSPIFCRDLNVAFIRIYLGWLRIWRWNRGYGERENTWHGENKVERDWRDGETYINISIWRYIFPSLLRYTESKNHLEEDDIDIFSQLINNMVWRWRKMKKWKLNSNIYSHALMHPTHPINPNLKPKTSRHEPCTHIHSIPIPFHFQSTTKKEIRISPGFPKRFKQYTRIPSPFPSISPFSLLISTSHPTPH